MSKSKFHESLRDLHQEIEKTEFSEEHHAEKIELITHDMREIMESPESLPFGTYFRFMSNLRGSVTHFEATHPNLTGVMNNVISTLNNLGI